MNWLNWPNRITIARVLLIAPFVICLLNQNTGWAGWRPIALILFLLIAIGDALDGFLARRLGAETPLGQFLDPVADKLLITCAIIMLSITATAVPGFAIPSWVPVIAIGKDIIVVIGFGLVYAVTGEFFVRPRILGKSCTLVQLVTIAGVLAAPNAPFLVARGLPGLWWLASGLAIAAALDYLRIGNRFAAEHHAQKARVDQNE